MERPKSEVTDELKNLYAKYLANDLSAAEFDRFNDLLLKQELEPGMQQLMNETWKSTKPAPYFLYEDVTLTYQAAQSSAAIPPKKYIRFRSIIPVAAAAAVVACIVATIYFFNRPVSSDTETATAVKRADSIAISPGGNKAMLTLADGSAILLDSAGNGMLADQGRVKVTKVDDGQLAYQPSQANGNEIMYNTISTPRGGQYRVVLADGSKVWLNSASSLRFPTAFTKEERTVQLTGEAYFEIAKSKIPFKVMVEQHEIMAVGTAFNVMAYADEGAIRTTLLEGAVRIGENLLNPGQQADIVRGKDGVHISHAVDISEALAWKNGVFYFNNTDIQTIMRQVSRWYDVDVRYAESVPDWHFTAELSRDNNMSKLLEMLQMTEAIRFKINGKTVIVLPK